MTDVGTTIGAFDLAHSAVGVEVPADGWIPAPVPGGVHEALLAAGLIPHPYRDGNEDAVRWVEERDWWYRSRIDLPADLAPDERVCLVFHGLDTVVDVWLDGELLGHHDNMFRPAEFDVTRFAAGGHALLLRFSPPLAGLEVPDSARSLLTRLRGALGDLTDPAEEGGSGILSDDLARATQRRKATFSWGWDFGPRVPSVGIWLPVELRRSRAAVLRGHHVRTDAVHPDGTADVVLAADVEVFATDDPLAVRFRLTAAGRPAVTVSAPVQDGRAEVVVPVPDAALWWTHDLGEPVLHDLAVDLVVDPGPGGESDVLDTRAGRVGLRTVTLDRSPDPEGGRHFRFLLNGVPVFARGAAWLPPSLLVGSVTDDRLHDLVRLARDGGSTMLRVWGGGIYEHDAFYAACDELGVMVWQDFAFACIDYPSEDATLAREVALEAEHQVARLRNHPCLALWCGSNEVQMVHGFAYQGYEDGNWGSEFFFRTLPDTVARLDGATPYWPGSPWGEDASEGWLAVNGVLDGDRHAWEVWHGLDVGAGGGEFASVGEARHYRRYAADRGKFVSEFGIHAAPERGTLERWVGDADLTIHSPAFDARNKDHPKDKHDAVLEIVTGLPTTLQEYVDDTMVSQAEGLKFGVEHYRRRQPHCSGALVWQFNDVWPGFSWSLVDFDLVPKAGYYAVKRAFAPLLASFRTDGDRLELWLSNAGRPVRTTVEFSVGGFDGREVLASSATAALGTAESRVVWSGEGLTAPDRYAWVQGPDVPANRLFFTEVKDVPFGPSRLDVAVVGTGATTATVTMASHGYTYRAHVLSPAPGVRFSDNHVDLPDGHRVTLDVEGLPAGFDVADLVVRSHRDRAVVRRAPVPQ
ncbi:glycoside hydrolase family 2 protein [Kineococcus sp. NPDC059986]|uniref:glycoside hydrolase family 2 protein n=1 Tax=Kineococcus sp. NPDC059986 TaxID=3155538 RepID=UPI00344B9B8B